nr:hypothetical protein [Campylobacter sp.]
MRTNAPRSLTWLVSLVLLLIGLAAVLFDTGIGIFEKYAYWWSFAGGALCILACKIRGL